MARNRKRAKERRSRRPPGGQFTRPGVATAPAQRDAREVDAPNPIEHAAPDVELADAQLALGRPELAGETGDQPEDFDEQADFEGDRADGPGGAGGAAEGVGGYSGGGGSGGNELAAGGGAGSALPAGRRVPGNRLINFLQGSWRELQRVQWPDRRQVMQATGVVIGFVIVAGVYLGVADTLATKLVNLILK